MNKALKAAIHGRTDLFGSIRRGLAALPRADNTAPDATVDPNRIVTVASHRAALDPDRALVVGNRGMGKSFWAHALANAAARERTATAFRELAMVSGQIGFNASERLHQIAPTPVALKEALLKCNDADALWRTVLVRLASVEMPEAVASFGIPASFGEAVEWVLSHGGQVDALLTSLDDQCARANRKLVLVFDALDRLADDWQTTRKLTAALLKRALAVRSYRSLRLKLFMRSDQFEDSVLFEFPDGSKIRNTRVDLRWTSDDLYWLLFVRLSQSEESSTAFKELVSLVNSGLAGLGTGNDASGDRTKALVDAIAGEYMGAAGTRDPSKRGRVFTWLPLHLSDSRGETSPRTFLTAWREAALHTPVPSELAVDHLGLIEGVRQASEDRLRELKEDYWWIGTALEPLRGQMIPMDRALLERLWRDNSTVKTIRSESIGKRLAPVQLEDGKEPEANLVNALAAIGVIEIRPNGKINIPDIFRVEAGIKRKGGVKPPKRLPTGRQ